MFFTNHLHVLTTLAERPDLRLREVADEVGITERAAHRIISELADEGYLTRTRVGSRNHYEVHSDAALRHPLASGQNTDRVLRLLTEQGEPDAADGGVEPGAANGRVEPDHVPARTPEASDLFAEVFRAAPVGMAVADANGRILTVNRAFCEILGRGEGEVVGHNFREFTHPDDLAADNEGLGRFAQGELSEYVREKRYIRPDGSSAWVKVRGAITPDPQTGAPLFVAHIIDIAERRRHDRALAEAEERFRSAFDNAPIGMALVAPDGRFIKVNRALCELTGYAEMSLLVRSFQAITHSDDLDADLAYVEDVLAGRRRTYQMEKRYYHADGHVIWVMLSVSLVRDAAGEPLYFISQIEDITQRKQREEALREQAEQLAVIASTDPLTGLSTRRAWDVAIAERTRRRKGSVAPFAVALIDLDGLKEINDTLGHHAGDDALAATAVAFRAVLRDGDLVARLGGDEFAILVPDADLQATLALAERILAALPEPLTASAGIAVWDGQETSTDLQRRADEALYAAKRDGKGHARPAHGEQNPRVAAGTGV